MRTGLGEGVWGSGGDGGRLGGQGELEQRQWDHLLLHPAHFRRILLLPGRSVLDPDARVHRLVPPQVVAVLELLVAGGADVGGPARLGEGFDWQTQQRRKYHNYNLLFSLNQVEELNECVFYCLKGTQNG